MVSFVPERVAIAGLFHSHLFLGAAHTDTQGNPTGAYDRVLRVASPAYVALLGYDPYFHKDFLPNILGVRRSELGDGVFQPGTTFQHTSVFADIRVCANLSSADCHPLDAGLEQRLYSFQFEIEFPLEMAYFVKELVHDFVARDKQMYGLRSLGS